MMKLKFKGRLVLVIIVLFLAVVYSLKRRFFRRRSVILDKYLEDNKDRGHFVDEELDAKVLDRMDARVNCNTTAFSWTGRNYTSESIIINQPECFHFLNISTVMFVYSNLTDSDHRELVRLTYGQLGIRVKFRFSLIFVIGIGDRESDKTRDEMNKVMIEREQMVYHDILQIRATDIPENDAIKALEALKWILKCAPSVVNIMKVGDNTVPNIPLLNNDLKSRSYETAHSDLFCQLETGQMIEDKNKQIMYFDFATNQKVLLKVFPPYCKRSLIVMSRYVAKQLLRSAENKPLYKLEDVYLTGLLRESACLPAPKRKIRSPKIVKNHNYNIGAYHFITFRKRNSDAFKKTWESALVFQKFLS